MSAPRTKGIAFVFAFIGAMAAAGSAHADGYRKLPATEKGVETPFELRVVKYDGAVNGQLLVEVRNTGKQPAQFAAEGLYFVPDGDPDKAPQRLGAVGPLQVKGEKGWESKDTVAIAAGDSVKVMLDVYCIDSHRPSPSSATKFRLGKTRLPKTLSRSIARDARKSAADNGGYAAPAAKSAVQGEVWKNRDAKWIKLDGEGAQEAAK